MSGLCLLLPLKSCPDGSGEAYAMTPFLWCCVWLLLRLYGLHIYYVPFRKLQTRMCHLEAGILTTYAFNQLVYGT